MRGCLFVVLVAAALVAGLAWFGSGPIAGAVIGAALEGSGYRAAATKISATADPPPRLLLGHADRVTIDGSDVDWRSLHARRVTLALDGVDLIGRSAERIRGTIDDAVLADGAGGSSPAASITLSGPADAAAAAITIDGPAVATVVKAAVARDFHIAVSDVQLVAPDRLRLATPNATIEGSMRIDPDGSLAFSTPLGSVTMLTIDPSIPLTLDSVRAVDGSLRLDGRLDVTALIGD